MGKTVSLSAADGHTFGAYTAGPEDASQGLVVIHEIFGVNSHVRDLVDRFAAAGYRVIAPALFDRAEPGVELGYGPEDQKRGYDLLHEIKDEFALKDVAAAHDALRVKSAGIVGYSWGAVRAWSAATRTSEFDAASCWYGTHILSRFDATANCPVQMHFGDRDATISIADVNKIKASQPAVEFFVYEGAEHGFGCDQRAGFNKDAFDLAQKRTLAFFAANLT